jgi:hypothetical protein
MGTKREIASAFYQLKLDMATTKPSFIASAKWTAQAAVAAQNKHQNTSSSAVNGTSPTVRFLNKILTILLLLCLCSFIPKEESRLLQP